jgi:hypothetical protein
VAADADVVVTPSETGDGGASPLQGGLARRRRVAVFAAILLCVGAARVWLATTAPVVTNDSLIYATVAANIQKNGCVSVAPPQTAECTPHWGGNQLPGYPALIAAVGVLTGRSATTLDAVKRPVLVVTASLFALACAWFGTQLGAWMGSAAWGLGAGLFVGLSPATAGWSRFVLTETLAGALWVLLAAEGLRQIAAQRVSPWPLGVLLAAAAFTRYDSFPLALVALALVVIAVGSSRAGGPLLAMGAIAAAPLALWCVRLAVVGLPLVPPVYAPYGWEPAAGAWRFQTTWMTQEEESVNFWWPIAVGRYREIHFNLDALDASERAEIERIWPRLYALHGQPMPRDIDEAFHRMADARRQQAPFQTFVRVPLARLWNLWTNPQPFFGGGWVLFPHAKDALPRIATVYRLSILALALVATVWLAGWLRAAPHARFALALLGAAALHAVAMTAAGYIETRYLAHTFPGIEAALAIGAALVGKRVRGAQPPGGGR